MYCRPYISGAIPKITRIAPHDFAQKTLRKCRDFRTKYGANLAGDMAYAPYAFFARAQSCFSSRRNASRGHVARTDGRPAGDAPALGILGAPKERAARYGPGFAFPGASKGFAFSCAPCIMQGAPHWRGAISRSVIKGPEIVRIYGAK